MAKRRSMKSNVDMSAAGSSDKVFYDHESLGVDHD
jgi:hypothetical protein